MHACSFARRPSLFLAALLAIAAASAAAQTAADRYPARPVRVVVPYPPGAGTDILGRAVAERLAGAFRQPFVVENKPGMGTLAGAEYVAKAAPDGYTLLIPAAATFGIAPQLYPKSPIDPMRDFRLVALLGAANFFLVASPAFPAKSVREMIDLVRRNPGKFNYGSAGSGSTHHLFMEALKKELGLDMQHVPYKGSILAVPDLISDKIQLMFLDPGVSLPNIQSGKLVALGSSMARQSMLIPSVPPIDATVPGYDWAGWLGLAAPAAVARPIIARIAEELHRFQQTPEYRELLRKMGMEPMDVTTQDQLADFMKRDIARWAAAIQASGAKLE